MSKKIAEGTGALVLDVKVGSGAFMKDVGRRPRAGPHDGRAGQGARRDARSPCSPTCPPRSAGPSATRSRSTESVEVLAGGGPADVVELTLALAREMLDGGRAVRRRPGRGARRRAGDGLLAGDDPGPGRRPGRAAAGRAARSRWSRAGRRASSPPSTRTRIGVAAWRLGAGPGPQGGPGQRGGRRGAAQAARRPGARRRRRCSSCVPTTPARMPAALAEAAAARCDHGGPPAATPLVIDRIG